MFRTYRIGRSSSADVRFDDPTLSRRQIEITVTDAGRYYGVACGGSVPTFLWQEGGWVPFSQGYLEPDARLAFGKRQVALAELIRRLPRASAEAGIGEIGPVSVKPRRKASTGEIEQS